MAIFWTTVGLNIATDIMLVIVPFPALLLITQRRTRFAISFVFGLAGIVVIVSTIRAILISKKCSNMNITAMLSHIEVATGVIISALPEVSRRFTGLYLQKSSPWGYSEWAPTNIQRSEGTTSGGTAINFRAKGAVELGFHNTASTDQINPHPIEPNS